MKLAANKRCTFTNHKPRRFSNFLCCDETPSLCDFARRNIYCRFQFGSFLPRVSGFQSLLVFGLRKEITDWLFKLHEEALSSPPLLRLSPFNISFPVLFPHTCCTIASAAEVCLFVWFGMCRGGFHCAHIMS